MSSILKMEEKAKAEVVSTTHSNMARPRRRAQSDYNRAVYGLAIFDRAVL